MKEGQSPRPALLHRPPTRRSATPLESAKLVKPSLLSDEIVRPFRQSVKRTTLDGSHG